MVHVCLDELKRLILDHPDCLRIDVLLELINLLSCDALTVLRGLESFFEDRLDISHSLNALSHAQAEVTEPLVVESDGPVLAEEFYHVRNDALIVSRGQGVEIVLVKSNKAPETLEDDLLTGAIERKVAEVFEPEVLEKR